MRYCSSIGSPQPAQHASAHHGALPVQVLHVHGILQDPSVPPRLREHFAMRFGVGVGGVGGAGVGGVGGVGGAVVEGGGAGRANDVDDRLPVPPVDSDADSMDEEDDDMEDDDEWDN